MVVAIGDNFEASLLTVTMLQNIGAIEAYEKRYHGEMPWLA